MISRASLAKYSISVPLYGIFWDFIFWTFELSFGIIIRLLYGWMTWACLWPFYGEDQWQHPSMCGQDFPTPLPLVSQKWWGPKNTLPEKPHMPGKVWGGQLVRRLKWLYNSRNFRRLGHIRDEICQTQSCGGGVRYTKIHARGEIYGNKINKIYLTGAEGRGLKMNSLFNIFVKFTSLT